MADIQSILDPLQVPKSVKADTFDAYHAATSTDDLRSRLDKLPLANSVKGDLWDLKNSEAGAAAAPSPASDSGWTLGHNPVSDFLGGIGAGAISTGVGAYNLARKVAPALPAPNEFVQELAKAPDSLSGQVGKMAEQAAEFVLPMGIAADAAKALPLAGKAATAARLTSEALTAGGVAGVQTGGNLPAAAESAGVTAALGGIGAAIPAGAKAALSKAIANGVRPLSQGAQALAQKYSVPLTEGMLNGSKTVQAVEKMVGHTVAPDLYEPLLAEAQEGLTKGAQDIAGSTDKFSAGQKTLNSLVSAAEDHSNTANAEYANLAALEGDPANTRTVQVGTKPNPSLDPTAPPIIPDMQPIGLPADMKPVKAAIAPEIADLERAMTPAKRNMDPGLTALKNIMGRPDALPASVAERDLGYLKDIQRSDASPQSKRLATIAIGALQPAVDDAVSAAGPDALASLQSARGSWAARASILDDVKALAGDTTGTSGQVRIAETLTAPGDRNYTALERVLASAPVAPELGQAYLRDRVFQNVTATGSDFTTPKQAQNLWNQMGSRTKAALYDPQTIQNVNDFLELSKRLAENPNPSGTGIVNTLLKAGVLISHPVQGAAAFTFGRNIAKVLYNPAAANNLRVALSQAGSPAGNKALRVVSGILNSNETAGQGNGLAEAAH